MNTDRFDDLPHIEATLNYLAPMAERPRNYTFDPPPGVPRSNSQPNRTPWRSTTCVRSSPTSRSTARASRVLHHESAVRTSGTRTRCGACITRRCSA